MSKVFPGKISTSVGTRNAYVHADGDVVVMCVGEDAEERADAVARAIAAHDKLVTMATFLQPSFGVDGIRVTITAEAFNQLESMLHSARLHSAKLADLDRQELMRAGPGDVGTMPADAVFVPLEPYVVDDICFTIGSAVRRRNRSQPRGSQPMSASMEYAATDLVLKALAECGFKVIPPGAEAGEADLCQLALAEVIRECDKVRAELKVTGHASEGDSLHRLVDAALDEERCRCNEEVAKLRGRLNAIREAVAA
ncbi:hypothetical protein NKJ10_17695 [Mesorhizobium sp. M0204]|uniref:hypothetical protein n=1 Tax=Mesorhizobium sp. M0204 TaxID=2956913 RepID=UPI0033377D2C